LTRRTALEAPEASSEARARDLDGLDGVHQLDPEQRVEYLRFSNVASAIRASVFRQIPFPDLAFGEDFAWAARALTAGWRLRFVPASVVYHAHRYTPRGIFERYRVDAAFHRLIHGHQVRPSAFSAARGFLYEVRQDLRFLREHAQRGRALGALRSPVLRGAQVLGQYVGSHGWAGGPRTEATGRMR
jgi:GT2 family glycosyltransferase